MMRALIDHLLDQVMTLVVLSVVGILAILGGAAFCVYWCVQHIDIVIR